METKKNSGTPIKGVDRAEMYVIQTKEFYDRDEPYKIEGIGIMLDMADGTHRAFVRIDEKTIYTDGVDVVATRKAYDECLADKEMEWAVVSKIALDIPDPSLASSYVGTFIGALSLSEITPVCSVYDRIQHYGGAEEGGWYYHTEEAIRTIPYSTFAKISEETPFDAYGEGENPKVNLAYGIDAYSEQSYYS